MPQSGACQVENNQDRQGENSQGPLEDNYHLEGSLLLDRDTLEHRVEGKGLGKDQKAHQLAGDPQRRVVAVGMEEDKGVDRGEGKEVDMDRIGLEMMKGGWTAQQQMWQVLAFLEPFSCVIFFTQEQQFSQIDQNLFDFVQFVQLL